MVQQPPVLYDIPSTAAGRAWAPNPWKARYVSTIFNLLKQDVDAARTRHRLALNAKGIPYRTVWVEYLDIAGLCKRIGAQHTEMHADGHHYTLPVLRDPNTGAAVSDSFNIVKYLDEMYPDTIRLIPRWHSSIPGDVYLRRDRKSHDPDVQDLRREDRPPAEPGELRVLPSDQGPVGDCVWKEMLDGLSQISRWVAESKGAFIMGETPSFADLVLLALLHWVKITEGTESTEWKDVMAADDGKALGSSREVGLGC
ncbi:hypothetical protein EVG20_g5962 [Dentipellis fragilis]|uniref:Uncharacterized protein n=1 Tax=Dentipellis fragilis TaxID=205917 RepID=A0A4Y9YPM7_9AGAM|nr:hypothetical protein EVG20_g5962 [Dentipellis fragilis]